MCHTFLTSGAACQPDAEKAILTLEGPRGRHPVQRVAGSPVDGCDFQGVVGRARGVWSRKEGVRVGQEEQDCFV